MSAIVFAVLILPLSAAGMSDCFAITVVDDQTGRGVPLVELKTVHSVRYFTDSGGRVAVNEPGLMGESVFFHVSSHGYEFSKDGFGYRGKALHLIPGGSATLRIKRINVAERLYRVTGAGIYRDSVLLGEATPIAAPVLNGRVFGSDSVVNAVYNGRVYWFWGDTSRPAYPLGNFHVPGATSALPGHGGLDPEIGVNLTYFLDKNGFAHETCRMPGDGPTWINGLVRIKDATGRERLFAAYVKVRNQLEVYERGLVEFNDRARSFEKVTIFPMDTPMHPQGHPMVHEMNGREYVVFADPFPLLRVPADPEAIKDLRQYESFTCLQPGQRAKEASFDRDSHNHIRYSWKAGAAVVGPGEQAKLIADRKLHGNELLLQLRDVETGKPVRAHGGSVCWNNYRNRWVGIILEVFGSSMLGEIWYAEADHLHGPWAYARKIITHDKYSFYNPKQHPMFDKEGGRILFFEGTYTHTFSGNTDPTPWYDYNQVMYKLDLADERLVLPLPVYRESADMPDRFSTQGGQNAKWSHMAFFACDRPTKGLVAVVSDSSSGQSKLAAMPVHIVSASGRRPAFFAMPTDRSIKGDIAVPLYEYVSADGTRYAYSAAPNASFRGYTRGSPVCRVWPVPTTATIVE